jgi:DNA-binding NtrC family response regulator
MPRAAEVSLVNFCISHGTLSGLPSFNWARFAGDVNMAIVLLVEGDDQVRVLAESYLEEQGHEVLSAGTADGALALLDKASKLDLLFTDVDLKDEIAAGIELAREAAARRPNLKVLYTTERSLTDGMKARFVKDAAFLPKPYTVEQLLTTLTVHFRISPQQRRQPVSV